MPMTYTFRMKRRIDPLPVAQEPPLVVKLAARESEYNTLLHAYDKAYDSPNRDGLHDRLWPGIDVAQRRVKQARRRLAEAEQKLSLTMDPAKRERLHVKIYGAPVPVESEDWSTYTTGELAFLEDMEVGLIPVKVIGIEGPIVQVQITASRPGYTKGHKTNYTFDLVIPRAQVTGERTKNPAIDRRFVWQLAA